MGSVNSCWLNGLALPVCSLPIGSAGAKVCLMRSRPYRSVILTILALSVSNLGNASELGEFCGKYTLIKSEASEKDRRTGSLTILQTGDQVQIERTWSDTVGSIQESNSLPLDGREVRYTTSGGATGTGSIQVKGRYLLVRAVVTVSSVKPSQAPVEMRQDVRLELSRDSKTLTVRTRTHFPSTPSLDMSETEKYARD